jgi:hypothetical protein
VASPDDPFAYDEDMELRAEARAASEAAEGSQQEFRLSGLLGSCQEAENPLAACPYCGAPGCVPHRPGG